MKTKDTAPSGLKATIVRWLGLDDYASLAGVFGGRKTSSSGVSVTAEKALTLSAVWRSVQLISQTIATLPLGFYAKGPDGRDPADDRVQIARLLQVKPNADQTAVVFWEQLVAAILLRGNGFAHKRRIGGRIVALDILVNDRLRWAKRLGESRYTFTYTESDGNQITIPEADIFHIPGFSLGGKFGLSVISYAAETFGTALASNTAASSTFKNGLMPTTYFKMERVLNKTQREEFRENMTKIQGALNAGKSPLLEGGMDVGKVGIDPDDAQLLESRTFSVEEVARWFGLPPQMIGGGDKASSWASSAEQMNLWFLQYALRPLLRRIEAAINTELLTPQELVQSIYAEFAVEGLLRGDTAARRELYASALQNGWMNRDEVRALENRKKVPGGDIYTAQSNLLPLAKLGQNPAGTPIVAKMTLEQIVSSMMEKAQNETQTP